MNRTEEKPQSELLNAIDESIRVCGEGLSSAGLIIEGSGKAKIGETTVSLDSRTGERERNNDTVLLFVPRAPNPICWAAAIADGVSLSYESKLGSRLACHTSIASLFAKSDGECHDPIARAAETFRQIGARIADGEDNCRPSDVSAGIWSRYVRQGQLFQSTLMVVWQVGDDVFLDGIGDGGFVLDHSPKQVPMMFLPDFDGPVNCLGAMTTVKTRGFGHHFTAIDGLYLFTDGVTPAIETDLDQSISMVRRCACRDGRNLAADLLRFAERSGASDDNLSLVAISR